MEHESQGHCKCCWRSRNGHQQPGEGIGRIGNQLENRNHPDFSIAEISQNTEKSPGDLRKLAAI